MYDANQKNTYSGGTDSITSLRLDEVIITDFSIYLRIWEKKWIWDLKDKGEGEAEREGGEERES